MSIFGRCLISCYSRDHKCLLEVFVWMELRWPAESGNTILKWLKLNKDISPTIMNVSEGEGIKSGNETKELLNPQNILKLF